VAKLLSLATSGVPALVDGIICGLVSARLTPVEWKTGTARRGCLRIGAMRLDDAVSLWDVHYILKSRGECWLSRSAVDKLKKWPERA
jgi:hypothetical protein